MFSFSSTINKDKTLFLEYPKLNEDPMVTQKAILSIYSERLELGTYNINFDVSDGVYTETMAVTVIVNPERQRIPNEITLLKASPIFFSNPAISDKSIVWYYGQWLGTTPSTVNCNIYYYDLKTGQTAVIDTGKNDVSCDVSKNWIIWSSGPHNYGGSIYVYDKRTGGPNKYLGEGIVPHTKGDYAVWLVPTAYSDGTRQKVHLYNLATGWQADIGPAGPSGRLYNCVSAKTDGEYVAWIEWDVQKSDSDPNFASIYYYKIGSGQAAQKIATATPRLFLYGTLNISNGILVWDEGFTSTSGVNEGDSYIRVYDLRPATPQLLATIGSGSGNYYHLANVYHPSGSSKATLIYESNGSSIAEGNGKFNYDIYKTEIDLNTKSVGAIQRLTTFSLPSTVENLIDTGCDAKYTSTNHYAGPSIGLGAMARMARRPSSTDGIYCNALVNPPVLNIAATANFYDATTNNLAFNVTDDDPSASFEYTISLDSVPSGQSSSTVGSYSIVPNTPGGSSGVFRWSPGRYVLPGSYAFTITAFNGPSTDPSRKSSVKNITITLLNSNVKPTVTIPTLPQYTEEDTIDFNLGFSDTDATDSATSYSCAYTGGAMPSGVTFNTSTGKFRWVTTMNSINSSVNGFVKSFVFNVSVNDLEGTTSTVVPMTINIANKVPQHQPVITNSLTNATLYEIEGTGQPTTVDFDITFSDEGGTSGATYHCYFTDPADGVTKPYNNSINGLTLSSPWNGSFTFVANPNTITVDTDRQIFNFFFTVKDSAGTESEQKPYTITVIHQPPTRSPAILL